MKFFTRVQKQKQVNPASKKLVETTIAKLAEVGIPDKQTQINCSNKLMLIFAQFVKAIVKPENQGDRFEPLVVQYTDSMKAAISGYGITDSLK